MNIEKYRNIPFNVRKRCVICGSDLDKPIINLPKFPLTEIFVKHPVKEHLGYLDQSFHFCSTCGVGLLANVINSDFLYCDNESYYFRTSESISGKETTDFFLNFLNKIIGKKQFETIVEIGCNDLYLLKMLHEKANKFIGIDPISNTKVSEDNIHIINNMYENVELSKDIDLVICKDTLEHIEEPKLFLEKLLNETSDNALFVFQFPLFDILLEEYRFDQIFHQHLNYFSLQSILYLLKELKCEIIDYRINRMHWGAILIAFKKGNRKQFLSSSLISSEQIIKKYSCFMEQMKHTNEILNGYNHLPIYGYGAGLMLPVLGYHLHNDFSSLEYILDDDKNKDEMYYINLMVTIKHIKEVEEVKNKIILVTAISSKINVRRIMAKLIRNESNDIILPLSII